MNNQNGRNIRNEKHQKKLAQENTIKDFRKSKHIFVSSEVRVGAADRRGEGSWGGGGLDS